MTSIPARFKIFTASNPTAWIKHVFEVKTFGAYTDTFVFYRAPETGEIIFDEMESIFDTNHYHGFYAFLLEMKTDADRALPDISRAD